MGKLIWVTVVILLPLGNLYVCVSTEENCEISASVIKSSSLEMEPLVKLTYYEPNACSYQRPNQFLLCDWDITCLPSFLTLNVIKFKTKYKGGET